MDFQRVGLRDIRTVQFSLVERNSILVLVLVLDTVSSIPYLRHHIFDTMSSIPDMTPIAL